MVIGTTLKTVYVTNNSSYSSTGTKAMGRRAFPVQCELWENDDVVFPFVGCPYVWRAPDLLWYHPILQYGMA